VSASLALARKYRPRNFSELLGQEHVVRALTHALETGRLHQAYLLTGTRGIGKTTIARILAKTLNCETGITATPCGTCAACTEIDAGRFPDLIELDAASNTGVDHMREIIENARYAPTAGRYKVYLIDEVHMLSKSAFNSMLKTLEEPPEHVKFVLATTDPQKIPVTVLSRCLQFNLKPFPPERVAEQLARVLEAEGIPFERPALRLIGEAAQGSMRDALSVTDQAIAFGGGRITEAQVREMLGSVDRDFVWRVLDALARGDAAALLAEAEGCLERGLSPYDALAQLARALHRIALFQVVPQTVPDDDPDREAIARLAGQLTPESVQLHYQICLHGRDDLKLAPDDEAALSMTFLRLHAFSPAAPETARAASPTAPTAPPPPPHPASAPAARSAPTSPPPAAAQSPEARSAAASPAAGPASPPPAFDGDWLRLVQALPLAAMARELARHSALIEFGAGTVRLALPQDKRPLLTQKERLAKTLTEYFGRPLKVEVELADQIGESVAIADQRAADERQRAAEAAFMADPVVQTILAQPGAQVVPGSIRPL
jgi:DNA polymerase-3 subunit gamma/tau